MALYPVRLLKDKNRHPFFPFNTLESVLVDGTNLTLKDVLDNIYTKPEINTMFATELSKVSIYDTVGDLPETARSGALAVVDNNNTYTMYVYYENAWHTLTQNGGGGGGGTWGSITGTLSDQTDLQNALNNKQDVIDTLHKLSSDLVDDTNHTNKFVTADEKTAWNNKGTYSKPSGGIPSTDLASAVQTALDKANTAIQANDLAPVATSGSYNDLSNKPTIPTVNNATLTIQKNGTTVETFTANASSNKTANIEVPTDLNELSNTTTKFVNETQLQQAIASLGTVFTLKGSVATVSALPSQNNNVGDVYYVEDVSSGYIWIDDNNTERWEQLGPTVDTSNFLTKTGLAQTTGNSTTNTMSQDAITQALSEKGTYSKPSGGIPASDLANAVLTSLGKADTAIQLPTGTLPVYHINAGNHQTSETAFDFSGKPAGLYIIKSASTVAAQTFYIKPCSDGVADIYAQGWFTMIYITSPIPDPFTENSSNYYYVTLNNYGELISKRFYAKYSTKSFTSNMSNIRTLINVNEAQTITGEKTFSTLPKSSVTPTDADHLVRKGYVDSVIPSVPTVNDATITIQKNSTTVDSFTTNASSNKTINITVPTKTSDITNDSNFMINDFIVIGNSQQQTISGNNTAQKYNFDTKIISNGDSLSFDSSSKSVKIDSNISYVQVSAQVYMISRGSNSTKTLTIRKNDAQIIRASYNVNLDTLCLSITTAIIPVQKNDKISLYIQSSAGNTVFGDNTAQQPGINHLTVKVIK